MKEKSPDKHARIKATILAFLGFLFLGACLWFQFVDKRAMPAPQKEIDFYGVFFRPTMLLTLPLLSAGCLLAALRIVAGNRAWRTDKNEESGSWHS